MHEQDWLKSIEPRAMLDFLFDRVSPRKLRLFACACFRQVWQSLPDHKSQIAVVKREHLGGPCDRSRRPHCRVDRGPGCGPISGVGFSNPLDCAHETSGRIRSLPRCGGQSLPSPGSGSLLAHANRSCTRPSRLRSPRVAHRHSGEQPSGRACRCPGRRLLRGSGHHRPPSRPLAFMCAVALYWMPFLGKSEPIAAPPLGSQRPYHARCQGTPAQYHGLHPCPPIEK